MLYHYWLSRVFCSQCVCEYDHYQYIRCSTIIGCLVCPVLSLCEYDHYQYRRCCTIIGCLMCSVLSLCEYDHYQYRCCCTIIGCLMCSVPSLCEYDLRTYLHHYFSRIHTTMNTRPMLCTESVYIHSAICTLQSHGCIYIIFVNIVYSLNKACCQRRGTWLPVMWQ